MNNLHGRIRRSLALAAVTGAMVSGGLQGIASAAEGRQLVRIDRVGDQLVVTGTDRPDSVTIRIAGAGRTRRVEFDLDRNRIPDRTVSLRGIAQLRVSLGGGNDEIAVSAANGLIAEALAVALDGGTGDDALLFQGSDDAETFAVRASADGGVSLTRDVEAVELRVDGVERIQLAAQGGRDQIVVGDLSAAGDGGPTRLRIDLGSGDQASDAASFDGSENDDNVFIAGSGGAATISGLTTKLELASVGSEDSLEIRALGGRDHVNGAGLARGTGAFRADGGTGEDVLAGGPGDDVLFGGPGADVLTGAGGDDLLLGNDGDDILDGGADDDVLIGGAGADVLIGGEIVLQD